MQQEEELSKEMLGVARLATTQLPDTLALKVECLVMASPRIKHRVQQDKQRR